MLCRHARFNCDNSYNWCMLQTHICNSIEGGPTHKGISQGYLTYKCFCHSDSRFIFSTWLVEAVPLTDQSRSVIKCTTCCICHNQLMA